MKSLRREEWLLLLSVWPACRGCCVAVPRVLIFVDSKAIAEMEATLRGLGEWTACPDWSRLRLPVPIAAFLLESLVPSHSVHPRSMRFYGLRNCRALHRYQRYCLC